MILHASLLASWGVGLIKYLQQFIMNTVSINVPQEQPYP